MNAKRFATFNLSAQGLAIAIFFKNGEKNNHLKDENEKMEKRGREKRKKESKKVEEWRSGMESPCKEGYSMPAAFQQQPKVYHLLLLQPSFALSYPLLSSPPISSSNASFQHQTVDR